MLENQKQIARLMRTNLVKLQEFTQDTDMTAWGKSFCSQVFDLCCQTELITYTKRRGNVL